MKVRYALIYFKIGHDMDVDKHRVNPHHWKEVEATNNSLLVVLGHSHHGRT